MSFNKKVKIGNVTLDNPLILSPMEAVNDIAFRHQCKKYGAGMVSTEMVSANSMARLLPSAIDLVKIHPEEHPVGTQMFGTDIPNLIQTAQILEGSFDTDVDLSSIKTDLVDLNVGCPSPRMLASGAGCALLGNVGHLRKICEEVAPSIDIPFTIKIRTGRTDNTLVYKEIVDIVNKTDVAALRVHGRTQKQMYSGKADRDILKECVELCDKPVVANGDVFDELSAEHMFEHTGCHSAMIGRGALGNPTVFKRIIHYFDTQEILPIPSKLEQIELFSEYLEMAQHFGIRDARLRQQGMYFLRGFQGAAKLRGSLSSCKSIDAMQEKILSSTKESDADTEAKL